MKLFSTSGLVFELIPTNDKQFSPIDKAIKSCIFIMSAAANQNSRGITPGSFYVSAGPKRRYLKLLTKE